MMQIEKYVRKTFEVLAVEVTAENIRQIAEWCDGEIRTNGHGISYIKVRVRRPLNDRQTRAYIGDWVVSSGNSVKVYTKKAFTSSFESAEEPIRRPCYCCETDGFMDMPLRRPATL